MIFPMILPALTCLVALVTTRPVPQTCSTSVFAYWHLCSSLQRLPRSSVINRCLDRVYSHIWSLPPLYFPKPIAGAWPKLTFVPVAQSAHPALKSTLSSSQPHPLLKPPTPYSFSFLSQQSSAYSPDHPSPYPKLHSLISFASPVSTTLLSRGERKGCSVFWCNRRNKGVRCVEDFC